LNWINDLLKQIMFTPDNISLIFLSPYCEVYVADGMIYLEREDRNQYVTLSCPDMDRMYELLSRLKNGMDDRELTNYLTEIGEENPVDWIACCFRGGVLE